MGDNLLQEFIFDAREHLSTAADLLLALEQNPGDLDSLNTLMGTLHTLKGNSGILELNNLYQLMHHAESLLQTIREKHAECPQPVVDLLLQVLDTAEAILNRLKNNRSDAVEWIGALLQTLDEVETQLEGGGEEPGPAEEVGEDPGPAEEMEADEPEDSSPAPEFELEAVPGAPTQVALADGDLGRAGALFPAKVEAIFKAGASGLVVDLKGLTELTGREVKLILAASLKKPDRIALLVDPDEQPDLHRLFQTLDPDGRLNLFPDQAPALAHLGPAA